MRKVRLGIIGCGLAAKGLHLPALQKLKSKFEIRALCNHTEPKAAELSYMLGGVPYTLDYKEMLMRDDIDAVDIALPIDLNYKVCRDALEMGKHVILEKPIAANLKEAEKMLAFPETYKQVMMIAENFRYRKVYRTVKKMISQNKIGVPYSSVWNLYYHVTTDSKYAKTDWRRHHKYPGGFMSDAGVHNIAGLRILFGEFTYVDCFTKSVNPAIGTPDTMSIQFGTDKINGIYNIFFTVKGHWEDKLLIFGSKGTIEVNTNKITLKKENQPDVETDASDDHGYVGEFTDFYNAITKGTDVTSTFYEGYQDLKVVLTALKAAESGRRIML